ncbi:hypothetical protein Sjap_017779 [Stephania japonica]|uniref:FAD-binding PCMH-type domain-containing protein n=1 Tax=Stephania japonica TaxID=461633 RepID=A0AAP0NKD4_9MAGN
MFYEKNVEVSEDQDDRILEIHITNNPETSIHSCESQVQAVVICSRKHGLQVRVRSRGHHFEGLSYTSPVAFILIDLVNLRAIDVDVQDNSVWVQAGATLGEVYYQIAKKSRLHGFPAGFCSTVGVGSHFSGGGYGGMMKKYGVAADHIIDARIVNVKGEILDRETWEKICFGQSEEEARLVSESFLHSRSNYSLSPSYCYCFTGGQSLGTTCNSAKSDFAMTPISKVKLKQIFEKLLEEENLKVTLSPWGGKMNEIPDHEIAFPHRAGNIPCVSMNPRAAYLNVKDLDLGHNKANETPTYSEARIWGEKYFKVAAVVEADWRRGCWCDAERERDVGGAVCARTQENRLGGVTWQVVIGGDDFRTEDLVVTCTTILSPFESEFRDACERRKCQSRGLLSNKTNNESFQLRM